MEGSKRDVGAGAEASQERQTPRSAINPQPRGHRGLGEGANGQGKPSFGELSGGPGDRPQPPVQLPAVEAPKGGGAVKSISERFKANAATGTGSTQIDLGLSPGRNGFGPRLGLSYDSGSGNSAYGLGWSLGVGSVGRKTSKGLPRYTDAEDTFVLSGGEDLIPIGAPVELSEGGKLFEVQRYRPRVEKDFARVERWRPVVGDDPGHWRTYSTEDIRSIFGRTAGARISDPTNGTRVFQWLLEEQRDGRGSAVHYVYKTEDGAGVDRGLAYEHHRYRPSGAGPGAAQYLKRILYGNSAAQLDISASLSSVDDWCFEVVFDYGEHDALAPTRHEVAEWSVRPDVFSSYRSGFEVRTYRRLQRVLMFHRFPELGAQAVSDGALVRSTVLTHDADPVASQLLAARQYGHRDGVTLSTPGVSFQYSGGTWNDQLRGSCPR